MGASMHRSLAERFVVRWAASSVGLWLAAGLSTHITYNGGAGAIIAAGFILAILNMLLKPLLIVLSLPAIILSLGLFMFVVNGLVVYIASGLYKPLQITSFWSAIFAGIIIGLLNWIISALLEDNRKL
jgi:putative membrane protein